MSVDDPLRITGFYPGSTCQTHTSELTCSLTECRHQSHQVNLVFPYEYLMPECELNGEVSIEFCSSSLKFLSIGLTQFKFHYLDPIKQIQCLVSVGDVKALYMKTAIARVLRLVFPSYIVTSSPTRNELTLPFQLNSDFDARSFRLPMTSVKKASYVTSLA